MSIKVWFAKVSFKIFPPPEKGYSTQIKDSVECTVVIRKENSGLGLQIVGGSDTYLVGLHEKRQGEALTITLPLFTFYILCLRVSRSVCLSVFLSVWRSACLAVCLSHGLSCGQPVVCLIVYLFHGLSVCPSAELSRENYMTYFPFPVPHLGLYWTLIYIFVLLVFYVSWHMSSDWNSHQGHWT